MPNKSVHSGHRERLKQSFVNSDFNGGSDVNKLEALLFYSIPRMNTNVTAHNLINSFGSLKAVFEADYEDILSVDGVGANSAFLIKLINNISKTLAMPDNREKVVKGVNSAAKALSPYFIGEKDEVIIAMFLNNSGGIIKIKVLAKGSVNSVQLDGRKLLENAMRTNASQIILAHNHPHGLAAPSAADLDLTRSMRNLLNTINIKLVDHVIFSDREFFNVSGMEDAKKYINV